MSTLKTAEEILEQFEPNREYPSYYHESNVLQAMEEYKNQELERIKGGGWVSVDTMPKDGTPILRWHKIYKCPIAVFFNDSFSGHPDCVWIEQTKRTSWPEAAFLEGWQPLLSPPTEKKD